LINSIQKINIYSVSHGWILLLLFIFLLPFSFFYTIPLVILCILGIAAIFPQMNLYCNNEGIKQYGLAFLCIYIPMIISMTDAVNFSESLRKAISFSLYYFIGLAVILFMSKKEKQKKLIYTLGALLTIWCMDAVWQSYNGFNILGYPYDEHWLTGVFHEKKTTGSDFSNTFTFIF